MWRLSGNIQWNMTKGNYWRWSFPVLHWYCQSYLGLMRDCYTFRSQQAVESGVKEHILIVGLDSESLQERFTQFLSGIIILFIISWKSKTSQVEMSWPRLQAGLDREQTKRNQREENLQQLTVLQLQRSTEYPILDHNSWLCECADKIA